MDVCVIGTGRMGRRHIDAVRGLGMNVVGIFDPMSEAMKLAVANNGVKEEQCFTSAALMLEKTRPSGVVVSSTGPSHSEYSILAAQAGAKYILCEKPMAASLEECDAMLAACKKHGALLAINHQMRFMEQYTRIKEMCESESFGGLNSVTVAASNFGLAMNASHYFEMFRYMTDEFIQTVQFWADKEKVPNPRGQQYSDLSGQIRAVTQSGKRLYMELGGDQGHGLQVIYGCRNGQIFVDEIAGHVRAIVRKPEHRNEPTTRYGMPCDELISQIAPVEVIAPTQSVWKALLAKENYPDGECGRHALSALVAAHTSNENGNTPIGLNRLDLKRKFSWA
jgi:predicted dehydrogenase